MVAGVQGRPDEEEVGALHLPDPHHRVGAVAVAVEDIPALETKISELVRPKQELARPERKLARSEQLLLRARALSFSFFLAS